MSRRQQRAKSQQRRARLKYFRERGYLIGTATGHALDALYGLPYRPEGMTDEQLRELMQRGYILAIGEPGDPATRTSPTIKVTYLDVQRMQDKIEEFQ